VPERRDREFFGIERLNALSDGLFAIVLTLLVLELKLPDATVSGSILDDLSDNYHSFIAWVISFLVIARFWVVHHGITARMSRCHIGTLVLNLAFLGVVSLMPFTASLIGSYEVREPWSTVSFALNLAAGSLVLGLFARHVTREQGLLADDTKRRELDWHRRHHLYVLPAVGAAAVALAFAEPYLAIGLMLGEFIAVMAVGVRRT
jgi:uncharacterized membrane protein